MGKPGGVPGDLNAAGNSVFQLGNMGDQPDKPPAFCPILHLISFSFYARLLQSGKSIVNFDCKQAVSDVGWIPNSSAADIILWEDKL